MLCTDTQGEMPAIRLDREMVELAADLAPLISAIRVHGHGDGHITLLVSKGRIPIIEWASKLFRGKKKVIN